MTSQVTLYDLPSREQECWSLNPWKGTWLIVVWHAGLWLMTQTARLVLNYKDIAYKTEWTEYPDLAPKLKSLYVE